MGKVVILSCKTLHAHPETRASLFAPTPFAFGVALKGVVPFLINADELRPLRVVRTVAAACLASCRRF